MEIIGLYSLLVASLGLQAATLVSNRKKRPAVKVDPVGAIILDTCALIDGRIQDVMKAGFISEQLFIPQRVVEELQFLADHGDAHKRSRARFGLDVAQNLQDFAPNKVTIIEGEYPHKPVDDVLILLAKEYGAALYTTDYNLNKVARLHGVNVLNINELAHAIRPILLPGENVTVKIVQKGESRTQGVGYLEDGTMAVIEGAAQLVGTQVSASIDRMLQTEAGKMVFARIERKEREGKPHAQSKHRGKELAKKTALTHKKQPRSS